MLFDENKNICTEFAAPQVERRLEEEDLVFSEEDVGKSIDDIKSDAAAGPNGIHTSAHSTRKGAMQLPPTTVLYRLHRI